MRQIILSQKEITEITRKFGQMFTDMFKDDPLPPIFIGVMKGAVPFMIDLVREIDCPVLLDFMQVSSYLGTESTGIISLKKDVSLDIRNRNVVIVEDIIDSGYTMNWLKNYIEKTYCPKKLLTCVLLDKKCKRKIPFECDFVGKEIGDYFIVGYGLDYDEFFRNEKEVFVPSKNQIEEIDKLREIEKKVEKQK